MKNIDSGEKSQNIYVREIFATYNCNYQITYLETVSIDILNHIKHIFLIK